MSYPTRYSAAGTKIVETDPAGPLVEYVDYAILREENARLKAEVERLNKPAVIGGYNISEYIRMANSETLEFDNGDIFADMTLPERIKYIVESHAKLKAEVERSTTQYNGIIDTQLKVIDELKAEVERLTERNKFLEQIDSYLQGANEHSFEQRCNELEAEVERLRKAGDAIIAEAHAMANKSDWPYTFDILVEEWNAAKEGKQP